MSEMKLVTFEPLDSLFFREAKPFNAGEGGFLDSQFPPSAQTLSGALRTAIGNATDLDWNNTVNVRECVGDSGDDPAPLSFAGPFLLKEGQRLYPVPLSLLYSEEKQNWTRLVPSGAIFKTDMGDRELPKPESYLEGAKPVEEGWLDEANMQKIMNGELPDRFIEAKDIFRREARVGIGRNNIQSVANKGQLYFTRHLRLEESVALGMAVDGAEPPENGVIRLGGEGRLVRYETGEMKPFLNAPSSDTTVKGLILTLITHGDFNSATEPEWKNELSNLELVSACVGKPVREGGWDYAERKPKPLKSLVPAGSCYFVRVKEGDIKDVIEQLHGEHIGHRKAFGYGEIAVGLWK